MGIKYSSGIIGGLTLLIAGVGVANIMYVSIKERTREIGIKMAVGAREIYILTQFLIEALMITFSAGLAVCRSLHLTEVQTDCRLSRKYSILWDGRRSPWRSVSS